MESTVEYKYSEETKKLWNNTRNKLSDIIKSIKAYDEKKYDSLIRIQKRIDTIIDDQYINQIIILQFEIYVVYTECYNKLLAKEDKNTNVMLKYLIDQELTLNNIISSYESILSNMKKLNEISTEINKLFE